MIIIEVLYLVSVYLVFFKYKLLPFNKISQAIVIVVGVTMTSMFLVALQTTTPVSVQAFVGGHITEIAPQVPGQVVDVPVEVNAPVEPGELLFRIDPRPYQYRVDQLKAQLVETEAYVAQLKEAYDAARASTRATRTNLALSELRLEQSQRLARTGAGSQFDVERYETEVQGTLQQLTGLEATENQALFVLKAEVGGQQTRVAQVLAQLEAAQFDLENTDVLAPDAGVVTMNALRPGMQVSPQRSVMTFVYTDDAAVPAVFPQKSLEHIRVGDTAQLSFPILPGRIFEGEVRSIPAAIGEAQFAAAGQVPRASDQRMTRLYKVIVTLPDDFPREHVRFGLAARVYIITENAGPIGAVATILHWVQSSMDYII